MISQIRQYVNISNQFIREKKKKFHDSGQAGDFFDIMSNG